MDGTVENTAKHTTPDGVPFDRHSQLEQIQSGLVEGERLVAVYDAHGIGTGFIGLTDRRVIIQDKSFVGEKTAVTSVPYPRISSVSVLSNKSFAGQYFSSGTIGIHVGALTYEVEFRGSEKAQHVHNVILNRIVGS
ncbi:PH domain-containing protein [Rugosimonospora africana]|uniref:PH domain-containing protein n=1 Tax=Rugosimonospora africana TaxID=556532 RepID=UPI0035711C44